MRQFEKHVHAISTHQSQAVPNEIRVHHNLPQNKTKKGDGNNSEGGGVIFTNKITKLIQLLTYE